MTRATMLGWFAPYWVRMAFGVLLGAATVLAGVGLLTSSSLLISKAALHPSIAEVSVIVVAVRFFGLSRAGLRYLERLVSHDVTFRLLARLRVWLFERLEPLAPVRFLEQRSGDLLTRITADVDVLQNLYLRALAPSLVAVLVSLVTCAGLALVDFKLGVAALAFLIACGGLVPLVASRLARGLGRQQREWRAQLAAWLVDDLQGMDDLQVFDVAATHQKRLLILNAKLSEAQTRATLISSGANAASLGLAHLGTLCVLALTVPLVQHGLDGIWLAALALGTLASFEAVQPLGAAWVHLEQSRQAAVRLQEFDGAPVAEPDCRDLPEDLTLQLEHVRLAYGDEVVLEDVSFTLAPGEHVGLIGPNGAGKSTIAHLLVRFLEPNGGRITLGGHDLRGYRPEDLRQIITVVSQDAQVFSTTIRHNLLLAKPTASQTELEHALKRARLLELVQRLPDGLDTWVGEGGISLSGGERQRLALARAFLHDAPILVLDEPTANLDPINARLVVAALHDLERTQLMRHRTVLTITHRLADLNRADQIVVLERGHVLETGRPAQLERFHGRYWRMRQHEREQIGFAADPRTWW